LSDCKLCGSSAQIRVAKSSAQLVTRNSILAAKVFDFHQCSVCGLVSVSPTPSKEILLAAYDESYPPHSQLRSWGRFSGLVKFSQERLALRRANWAMGKLQKHKGNKKKAEKKASFNLRLLDYGYGTPGFLEVCARSHKNSHCVGLDPFVKVDQALIMESKMKSKPPETGGVVHLKSGGLDCLGDFNDQKIKNDRGEQTDCKFNLITLWHVIEHEQDPVLLLSQLKNIADCGGILIIETPNFDTWARHVFGGKWPGYHTPRHLNIFTKSSLSMTLEKSGWSDPEFFHGGFFDDFTFLWLARLDLLMKRRGDLNLENEFLSYLFLRIFVGPLIWLFGSIAGRGTLLVKVTKLGC
jgi:2-polyprenyl-3-methyl-5-hydroxy-6-metoxy-1,4-benzoquinol methylase